MDNAFSSLSTFGSSKKASSPKKKAFMYVILFVLIIGAAIFVGNYFLSGKSVGPKPTPQVTQAPTATPTPTPVASVSATPTSKTTPTPSGKVTPTKSALTPTPSATTSLQIEVLNGSGISGMAGKVATLLKSDGYGISSTGNAATFDYPQTVIQIKKSKAQAAAQLKKDLSVQYTVDPTVQTLAETATPDAIVIVGAK
ncbi:hypothetical protein BH09PAT1_BH09PAT1_8660 [soil metagenome]